MKKILSLFLCCFFISYHLQAQEYFTISDLDIRIKVNKNSSLEVVEKIKVRFTEPRHGIYRKIPYRYKMDELPKSVEKARVQLIHGSYHYTIVDHIKVPGWNMDVNRKGDYEVIKIGSNDKWVDGDQEYTIKYRVRNSINFFEHHSEFYFNVVGTEWPVSIDHTQFTIEFYKPVPDTTKWFVASGIMGSREKMVSAHWQDSKTLTGHTLQTLNASEGVTVGVEMPEGFLAEQDYRYLGWGWIFLPIIVFFIMIRVWKRWGKDFRVTVQTEYYPPENVNPSIAGYIIDDKLNKRDLTVLIPYWGARGFLRVKEVVEKKLFGLYKNTDYEFTKLKNLPPDAKSFEQTIFNGLFKDGNQVLISDLKDKFYSTMNLAKADLEREIDKEEFYVKYTRALAVFLPVVGGLGALGGVIYLLIHIPIFIIPGICIFFTGVIIFLYGIFMDKKTKKGTKLYEKLLGFREFIRSVEKDRLKEFLTQDASYFDKVLPYAIVFNMAGVWKDKLKGLDVPPPNWYAGSYAAGNFSAPIFLNKLDHSMDAMSSQFYSAPSSSGSSGGSFGGGGGGKFSGGGFGGGGGGSW